MASMFLCDHMLIRLGRWLRAAGYDTAIASGAASDRALLAQAVAENRLVVTRDRKLGEFREAPGRVLLLRAGTIEACAAELTERRAIDWLYRPFTRCLDCNMPLLPVSPELWQSVPETSRATGGDLRCCPQCRKLYWPGGHVRRMRHRLERWRNSDFVETIDETRQM
ncbi:Mut7-C RNAse domain-containing protein [Rhodospirillaceae bacterium SYSU D60014]|uniref:Mut7-C RNAse domain-containing protein n=1 Tax=Virgifigura deserti TaxID=2268457 RepID=UPI000E669383